MAKPTSNVQPNQSNSPSASADVGKPIRVARPVKYSLKPLSPKQPNELPVSTPDFLDASKVLVDLAPNSNDQQIDSETRSTTSTKAKTEPPASPARHVPDVAEEPQPATLQNDPNHPEEFPQPALQVSGESKIAQPELKHVTKKISPAQVSRPGIDASTNTLVVERFTLSFQGETLFNAVDFQISTGEIIGLGGLSARASHSLFQCIIGAKSPSDGSIFLGGKRPQTVSKQGKISWLKLQNPDIRRHPWPLLGASASSSEILTHAARLQGLNEPKKIAATYEELMGLTGDQPSDFGWQLPYYVRLQTALALMPNPSLLLVEFPTRDLGVEQAQWLWTTLEQFQDDTKASVLITSNDFDELERLCDHILLFNDASIVAQGAPIDLALRYGRDQIDYDHLELARSER